MQLLDVARAPFVRFLAVGGTGTLLNLGLSWLVTSFVGIEHYVWGTVIGLAANILFNFTLYSIAVFHTQGNHARRLVIFSLYSLCIAGLYLFFVKSVTTIVGAQWYLIVSLCGIILFAIVNFLALKFSIFKEV